jgi:drug/metabolite transporter (DMT)-like permease
MAESWIFYALASAIFTGIQSFILKIIAQRGYSTNIINGYALVVASVIGLATVALFFGFKGSYLVGVGIAAATGIMYMLSAIARTRSLRHLNDAFAFSAYKSGTVLLAALAGVLFFEETLTLLQMIGIGLALVVPFFMEIARKDDEVGVFRKGIALLAVAIVAGAGSAALNKLGAPLFETALMFGVFNYLFGMVTGFSLQAFEHRLSPDRWFLDRRHRARETVPIAIALGLMIFLAFSSLMLGFRFGPLSVVYAINSTYFIIPVVLSTLLLHEKRRWLDWMIVLISLVAVTLMAS